MSERDGRLDASRDLFQKFPSFCPSVRLLATGLITLWAISNGAVAQQSRPDVPFSSSVSATGAYQLKVPLRLPAGNGGVTPSLELTYDSQRSDPSSMLGPGWSLSGLSRITRCAATAAQDEAYGFVSGTVLDRFCLNDERLVLINGTYGRPGSEYRTEHDSRQRIMYKDGWWSVEMGDGSVAEIGRDPNARFKGEQAWALSKFIAPGGNYFTVTYTPNMATYSFLPFYQASDTEIYPKQIDYVYSNGSSFQRALFTYASWGPRIRYAGKNAWVNGLHLSTITMSTAQGQQFLYYGFGIEPETDDSNASAHLVQILVGMSGTTLRPLAFTWDVVTPPLPFQTYSSDAGTPPIDASTLHLFADVTGTGKKSWIQIHDNGDAWLGTATGANLLNSASWAKLPRNVGPTSDYTHIFADIDGDGRADWIRLGKASGTVEVALSKGAGQFGPWSSGPQRAGGANQYRDFFADIDGDGKADWIQLNTTNGLVSFMRSNGDGTFTLDSSVQSGYLSHPDWQISPGQLDGLGFNGLIFVGCDSGVVSTETLRRGAAPAYAQRFDTVRCDALSKAVITDLNSDAIVDIVQVGGDSDCTMRTRVLFGLGQGAFTDQYPEEFSTMTVTSGTREWLVDSTATGRPGLVSITGTSATVVPARQDLQLGAGVWQKLKVGDPSYVNHYFADLDGDGKADWIEVNPSTGKASIRWASGAATTRIVSVSNGLGWHQDVSYSSLRDPTVYTPGSGAIYPFRNVVTERVDDFMPQQLDMFQPQLAVVKSLTDVWPSGSRTKNYKYGDLQGNLARRSLTPFASVVVTDSGTNLSTEMSVHQDFPLQGLPISSVIKQAGRELKRTSYSYACRDFVGAGCTELPGRRYFSYLSSSYTTASDLNGTALPSVGFSASVDGMGNVVHSEVQTNGVTTSMTDTTFLNDEAKWRIVLPLRQIVTSLGN